MTPSLDGRRFTQADRLFSVREDREGTLTGTFTGGSVTAGALTGRRDGADVTFGFAQIERNGVVTTGTAQARVEVLPGGRLRLQESWRLADGTTGEAVLEELPGTPWVRTRVAVPTRSIPAAVAFYGDLLGFAVDGPHAATPYEIAFVDLPGGTQLELTAGGELPLPATRDDLLVLYVPTSADVDTLRLRLGSASIALEEPLNPYWGRMGITVRDPDGRLVVLASLPF